MDYSQHPAPTAREDVAENPPAPVVAAPPAAAMRELRIARAALRDAFGILDADDEDFSVMVSDVDDLVFALDNVLRTASRNR